MALIIRPSIEKKIGSEDHGCITPKEIHECFENHCGRYALDPRPQHLDRSGNPTPWIVGCTNRGRRLKVHFVQEGEDIEIKTAYPATDAVVALFERLTSGPI